jgi:hypothetical protein
MRKACLHLHTTGPPGSRLSYDHHQLVSALYDPFRFDPEPLKALEPAAKEALETVASAMRARLGARTRLVPLDVGIEQIEHDREVTTIQSGVPALECLDVRLAHAGQYIRLVSCDADAVRCTSSNLSQPNCQLLLRGCLRSDAAMAGSPER